MRAEHVLPGRRGTRGGPAAPAWATDRRLEVTTRGRVAIVALHGGLDEVVATMLIPALTNAARGRDAVVLVLDDVTLLDRAALVKVCTVIDVLPRPSSCCIVAGRLSGRMVLRRWGLQRSLAIFSSVGDALQARTFAEIGYGPGWSPAARLQERSPTTRAALWR